MFEPTIRCDNNSTSKCSYFGGPLAGYLLCGTVCRQQFGGDCSRRSRIHIPRWHESASFLNVESESKHRTRNCTIERGSSFEILDSRFLYDTSSSFGIQIPNRSFSVPCEDRCFCQRSQPSWNARLPYDGRIRPSWWPAVLGVARGRSSSANPLGWPWQRWLAMIWPCLLRKSLGS